MFDEETSVMMHQANLDLSDHPSPTGSPSSHGLINHRRDAQQSAKAKSDSSMSAIPSKSIKRISAFLPRSDTSRSASASPHPTQAQADPYGSGGDHSSQAIISASSPPAEPVTSNTAAASAAFAAVTTTAAAAAAITTISTTCTPTATGDARDHASSQGGSNAEIRSPPITSPKMLLSDLYKSTKSPLARFRHHPHSAAAIDLDPDYHADLVSRDKLKQKEAVKRYLADRIRNDWMFQWPPPNAVPPPEGNATEEDGVDATNDDGGAEEGREAMNDSAIADSTSEEDTEGEEVDDDNDDTLSNYSTVSEDLEHFRPRAEWLSDLSEEDEPTTTSSAYRFDSPDAVGSAVEAGELARSAKRRRAVRDEMQWNSGLACFNARRDAWTGAKTVRVRTKPPSPSPPPSPPSKRLSWFRLSASAPPMTPLPDLGGVAVPASPTSTRISGDTTIAVLSSSSDGESRTTKPDDGPVVRRGRCSRVETLLPIPPPLLPAANPMRASITPATYPSIYDKIVVHSMTPACPINLHDVIRACVTGWKRDGEWPCRGAVAAGAGAGAAEAVAPVVAVRKKKAATTAARRGSGGAKNGGSPPPPRSKPNAARRMSLGFLGRKETAVGAAAAAAGAGSPPKGGGGGDDHGGASSSASSSRGLRKSLQRVLGLGHDRLASNTVALG